MPLNNEALPLPDFEIDHPEEFGQFILGTPADIEFYLGLLARRRSIITVYINEGTHFFLSSIVALDEETRSVFLDPAQSEENNTLAVNARELTLVANLDRVKIQIRLPALQKTSYQGHGVLGASLPSQLLRLQRREFFRLEPPTATPIHCKLAAHLDDGTIKTFELILSDISGGGVSLTGTTEMSEDFQRDTLFNECRLEIPGEGVIQVNLRVRKAVEVSTESGDHNLRIGCEFVNLPSARLAFIERYITRVERERKARDTGLLEN
ncbi:MAG: flagellar brake protein [Rhodocyclales bacterium GT-UBC]|nr:MAG: flagellar brake protein [Rhodocyclales bacterium GT-UBC]